MMLRERVSRRIKMLLYRKNLGGVQIPDTARVRVDSCIISGGKNLIIGNYVRIGPKALIYCSDAKIIIRDKVNIGPGVTMVSGDHNYKTVGKYICDEYTKLPDSDADIIINSDCWIGANVTILKGVEIGRGCVVAACALVTKSMPPYSIVAGVPAKVIGKRFNSEEIARHESILYGKKIE